MIALFFVAGVASAGLLDALDGPGRHLAGCQQAAADAEATGDNQRAVGVWEVCLSEAERREFTTLLPELRGQVAVEKAWADAAPRFATDPHHAAMDVLAVAARWSTVDLPTDLVVRTFRGWMQTDEGRAYVADVRTVTVNWEGKPDPHVSEVLRRSVEDAGLKWATPGDPDVDTIVSARAEVTRGRGAASAQGQLVLVENRLVVSRVRVKARDATLKGFTVSAVAEAPTDAEAAESSLRVVTEAAAHRLLQRVLGLVFAE